jgi:hypothetical protein
MALNKLVKRLNLESETIDTSDVEEQTVEDVVEQDVAASDLKDAVDELKELHEDFEDGEATAEELQEAIDHTKEVIEEAEAKAEESGEEAEVPVEEIVAAQESLRYFYKQIGLDPSEMVTVSREDIHTNSLQAYKELQANLESVQVNLEGILGNIAAKIKEVVSKLWDKLKIAFGSTDTFIKTVLKELEPYGNVNGGNYNLAWGSVAYNILKTKNFKTINEYTDNASIVVNNLIANKEHLNEGVKSVSTPISALNAKIQDAIKANSKDDQAAVCVGFYPTSPLKKVEAVIIKPGYDGALKKRVGGAIAQKVADKLTNGVVKFNFIPNIVKVDAEIDSVQFDLTVQNFKALAEGYYAHTKVLENNWSRLDRKFTEFANNVDKILSSATMNNAARFTKIVSSLLDGLSEQYFATNAVIKITGKQTLSAVKKAAKAQA